MEPQVAHVASDHVELLWLLADAEELHGSVRVRGLGRGSSILRWLRFWGESRGCLLSSTCQFDLDDRLCGDLHLCTTSLRRTACLIHSCTLGRVRLPFHAALARAWTAFGRLTTNFSRRSADVKGDQGPSIPCRLLTVLYLACLLLGI